MSQAYYRVSLENGSNRLFSSSVSSLKLNCSINYQVEGFVFLILCFFVLESSCFVIPSPQASLPRLNASLHFSFSPSLSPSARLKRHSSEESTASQLNSQNPWIESRLPIIVRNNGGETFREIISANSEQDYIRIEFQETDGSLVKLLVDFKNNFQIFRLVRLGEQDLNEQKWQTYCFVTRLPKNEYISSDAMSKLTQKNPATIRMAELDRGTVMYNMNLEIQMDKNSQTVSRHLNNFCGQAHKRIYASEEDLVNWTAVGNAGNRTYMNISPLVRKLTTVTSDLSSTNQTAKGNITSLPRLRQCGELLQNIYKIFANRKFMENMTNITLKRYNGHNQKTLNEFLQAYKGQVCHCSLSLVIPFYPCSVKYCTAKDPNNPEKLISYRCSIKTCRRRIEFRFAVADKLFCLRDLNSMVPEHARPSS